MRSWRLIPDRYLHTISEVFKTLFDRLLAAVWPVCLFVEITPEKAFHGTTGCLYQRGLVYDLGGKLGGKGRLLTVVHYSNKDSPLQCCCLLLVLLLPILLPACQTASHANSFTGLGNLHTLL